MSSYVRRCNTIEFLSALTIAIFCPSPFWSWFMLRPCVDPWSSFQAIALSLWDPCFVPKRTKGFGGNGVWFLSSIRTMLTKSYNSSIIPVHSLTIRPYYTCSKAWDCYRCYVTKCQPNATLCSLKMLYLLLVTQFIHVTHMHSLASDPLSHLQDKGTRVVVSQPAGYAVCDGNVSSDTFILLVSVFFWQHVFFTYFPTSDFDQTWSKWPVAWPLLTHKRWWGQGSLWGHWGQKGHFHQKGIKSFRIRSIDTWLMHMH